MSRLRVGLLGNPRAAHGAAERIARQVESLLRVAGISVVDLSATSASVARARALEVRDTLTALVVVGGDGTVALGADVVAHTPVRLGIVPAGSGNDLALALGLPLSDPEESVRQMLQALSRPVVTVDAIELVSDIEPTQRTIALGNVSLGFDALVNARANDGRLPPRLRYTGAVLRELPAFHPITYRIEIDGSPPQDIDATLLTISNSGILGGGMRLSPNSRVDDGTLELATLEGLTRTALLRFFPRVFTGRHLTVPGFSIRSVREIKVGLRDGALLRAFSDGEPRTVLPVRARVLPGAVRILADLRVPGTVGG